MASEQTDRFLRNSGGSALEHNTQRLGVIYRRRALFTTLGVAAIMGGALLPGRSVVAQNSPAQTGNQTTQGNGQTPPQNGGQTNPPNKGQTNPPNGGQTNPPGNGNGTSPGTGGANPRVIVPTQRQRGSRRGNNFFIPDGAGGQGSNFPNVRPGTMTSLSFTGADISTVLKFYSNLLKETVVADPSVTGPVTIYVPTPVSVDEAFRILQQVLLVRGFTAVQKDNVLTIAPLNIVVNNTPLFNPTLDPTKLDPRDEVMTQIIPLENVDAATMAKDLQPLINKGASLVASSGSNALIVTDLASNVKKIIDMVQALDKTSSREEMAIYQLHHAEATVLADLINSIYSKVPPRSAAGNRGPGFPGIFIQPQQQQQGQQNTPPNVFAVGDANTNSLIVVASRDVQEQITHDIINRMDDDDTKTLDTQFRTIHYTDAVSLASEINTVLSNMHGNASSTNNNGQRGFGGGFPFFGGGGGGQTSSGSDQVTPSTDPYAKLSADAHTNSVIITASAEKMAKINEWIDQLDRQIKTESTTFVIPLAEAQAADVANALTNALSNTSSSIYNPMYQGAIGGNGSRGGSGGGVQGHTPIQRRPSTTTVQGGGGRAVGGIRPPGPPNAPDGGYLGDGSGQYGDSGSAIPNGIPGIMTLDGRFVPTETRAIGDPGSSIDPSASTDSSGSHDITRQIFGGQGGRPGGGFGQTGGVNANRTSTGVPLTGPGTGGQFSNLLQLQNNVTVVPSPNGDALIVTTTPNNYEAIKGIVEALDVVPRQVMLEVIVAEVSLDDDQKLGMNFTSSFAGLFKGTNGTTNTLLPAPTFSTSTTPDPTVTGGQYTIAGKNYSSLISALGTDDKVKVLATPRVFTANNQPALIDIATQVPYITGQTVVPGTVTTAISNTVDYASIGFTLYVTPRITRDGQVTVDVVEDASDLVTYLTLGTGTNAVTAPEFNDRYADSTITVKDNDTAVLGGIIRSRDTLNILKIPILSDLPLIGQFFRSREKERQKVELMIFVTPHIIQTSQQMRDYATKAGAPVINQLPDLPNQQSNLQPSNPQQTNPNSTKAAKKKKGKNTTPPTSPSTTMPPTTQPPNTQNQNGPGFPPPVDPQSKP